MKGPCAFCGEIKTLSREHLFARWLHPFLPPQPPHHFSRETQARISELGVERRVTPYKRVGRPKTAMQPKIVCTDCNNGWMSGLQAYPAVLAMVRGTSVVLGATDRAHIARWATMTSMCFDFREGPRRAIPPEERAAFFGQCSTGSELDLPGWEIAVGQYMGTERDDPFERRYRNRVGPHAYTQATTLRYGCLVVIAHSGLLQLNGLSQLVHEASYQSALQYVYPDRGSVTWPPSVSIHDALMDRIVFRIREALVLGIAKDFPAFVQAGTAIRKARITEPDVWPPEPWNGRN